MDLGPVDRITADAVGPPGQRVFYLQTGTGDALVTVVVEKQQVELLATSVLELLSDVSKETGPGPSEEEMGLVQPVEPRWRAGRISIGYDGERDLFQLEISEYLPEADEAEDEAAASPAMAEPETLRLWATREQMLAFSRHGEAVAARGRPACRFCGNPIDPEGHTCPATNGHRRPRS